MVQYDIKFSKESKKYSVCLWNIVNIIALCIKITNFLILSEFIFTGFLWSEVDTIRILFLVKTLQSSTVRLVKLKYCCLWFVFVLFCLLIFILIRFWYTVWIIVFFLLITSNNFPTTFQIYELLPMLIIKININKKFKTLDIIRHLFIFKSFKNIFSYFFSLIKTKCKNLFFF